MCKINFKNFFSEKLNTKNITKSIVWLIALKSQGNFLKKKKKKKNKIKQISNNPKNDRYLDIQNINKKKKIKNLALLFIVT